MTLKYRPLFQVVPIPGTRFRNISVEEIQLDHQKVVCLLFSKIKVLNAQKRIRYRLKCFIDNYSDKNFKVRRVSEQTV